MDEGADDFFTKDNKGYFPKEWFLNREIICGNESIQLFEEIFSLPKGFRISKVLWRPQYFSIKISDDGSKIYLSREDPKRTSSKEKLVVKYSGINETLKEKASENLARWLAENSPSKIFLTIFLDEGATIRKGDLIHKNTTELNFTEWYYFHFGKREADFLFMNQGQFSTRVGGGLHIHHEKQPIKIEHGDYECRKMGEHLNKTTHNAFLDTGLRKRNRQKLKQNKENKENKNKENRKRPSHTIGESVMYDNDIIKGGSDNLSIVIQ
ncbi:MAG: hypothetical protein ACLFSL_03920, partial [Candidatus Woesearchaeota archaeon]